MIKLLSTSAEADIKSSDLVSKLDDRPTKRVTSYMNKTEIFEFLKTWYFHHNVSFSKL